ncbi:mCG147909 [Mus musculus]|nr:mCG147909 [Mus musculus]
MAERGDEPRGSACDSQDPPRNCKNGWGKCTDADPLVHGDKNE